MKPPSPLKAVFLLVALVSISIVLAKILKTAETPPWRTEQATSLQIYPENQSEESDRTDFQPFTFMTYNVKNWLTSSQGREKSPEAKAAVIRIISEAKPDIVGLSEIGSPEDVLEIQEMLEKSGCHLPHLHYSGGTDTIRHLVLLSRFPIVSNVQHDPEIPGKGISMRRGILDATIDTGSDRVRFMGIHLKSKRTVPDFDQAMLRFEEATHVRNQVDLLLSEDPEALLVVYGDFNDSTRSLSTKAIFGTYRTPLYLAPVHVKDQRGESWTYFYEPEDIYSRIDFVTVSKVLKSHVDKRQSRICNDPAWNEASDHRPVLIRFQ